MKHYIFGEWQDSNDATFLVDLTQTMSVAAEKKADLGPEKLWNLQSKLLEGCSPISFDDTPFFEWQRASKRRTFFMNKPRGVIFLFSISPTSALAPVIESLWKGNVTVCFCEMGESSGFLDWLSKMVELDSEKIVLGRLAVFDVAAGLVPILREVSFKPDALVFCDGQSEERMKDGILLNLALPTARESVGSVGVVSNSGFRLLGPEVISKALNGSKSVYYVEGEEIADRLRGYLGDFTTVTSYANPEHLGKNVDLSKSREVILFSAPNEALALTTKLSLAGVSSVKQFDPTIDASIKAQSSHVFEDTIHFTMSKELGQYHPIDLLNSEERAEIHSVRLSRQIARMNINATEVLQSLSDVPPMLLTEFESRIEEGERGRGGGYVHHAFDDDNRNIFIFSGWREWDAYLEAGYRALSAAGLNSDDTVASCMQGGDLQAVPLLVDQINAEIGARVLPFSGHVSPEEFLDVCRKFQVTAVEAPPGILLPLLKICKQQDKGFSVPKIIHWGSPVSAADADWMRTQIGAKSICSILFGKYTGIFGYQCGHLISSHFHLLDDVHYVEILSENGTPVSDGEVGRIFTTSFTNVSPQYMRLESGALGRLVNRLCSCGRTSRILEYLGNEEDALYIAGMRFGYKDLLKAFKEHRQSALQLVAQNTMAGEWLTVRVEADDASEDFKRIFEAQLYEAFPNLQARIDGGSLMKVETQFFKTGELPRDLQSGKIIPVLDERI